MKRSVLWRVARKMPPLRHSIPGQEFDFKNSEVCKWLMQQPEIMSIVFNNVQHGDIVFDSATGTWQGKDYAT